MGADFFGVLGGFLCGGGLDFAEGAFGADFLEAGAVSAVSVSDCARGEGAAGARNGVSGPDPLAPVPFRREVKGSAPPMASASSLLAAASLEEDAEGSAFAVSALAAEPLFAIMLRSGPKPFDIAARIYHNSLRKNQSHRGSSWQSQARKHPKTHAPSKDLRFPFSETFWR